MNLQQEYIGFSTRLSSHSLLAYCRPRLRPLTSSTSPSHTPQVVLHWRARAYLDNMKLSIDFGYDTLQTVSDADLLHQSISSRRDREIGLAGGKSLVNFVAAWDQLVRVVHWLQFARAKPNSPAASHEGQMQSIHDTQLRWHAMVSRLIEGVNG